MAEKAKRRFRTGAIGGNQERIDELEYFIEAIGRFVFGAEGEDFRRLRDYVAPTRNMSALMDMFRGRPSARDIAEDLRYLYSELESHAAVGPAPKAPAPRVSETVFRFDRYVELSAHPEQSLNAIDPALRLEVAEQLTRGVAPFRPMLARLSAYAWLATVGLPNLEEELSLETPAYFEMTDTGARTRSGLERFLNRGQRPLGKGLRAYFEAAFKDLEEDYRGQLARYAAKTTRMHD